MTIARVVVIRDSLGSRRSDHRATLRVLSDPPFFFDASAIGLEVGDEVEVIEWKHRFVIKSSPERREALAEKMYSDLVSEHGEHLQAASLKDLLISLLDAANDVDEPPLDYYQVARWLIKRYSVDAQMAEIER